MKAVYLLLSVILTIFLCDSCVEPTEGCLDEFSSNYSLFADKECEDCCTYPNFNISTSYLYGDSIAIDTALYYENGANSYFKLRSFYLVISEFELHGDAGDYKVRSKIEDKEVSDDLVGLRYRTGTNNPGDISIEDSIRSVDFKLGLPEALDTPDNADLEYDIIELLSDSMYVDDATNRFYKMIIEIEVDSMSETVIFLPFPELDITKSGSVVAGTTRGNSLSIQLSIDFMRLFNGIAFQSMDLESEAVAIILQNIEEAIELN